MPEVPPRPSAAAPPIVEKSTSAPVAAPAAAKAQPATSDIPWYVLAVFLGMVNGAIELATGDLLLTSFFALFFCMMLGALRPARPWRWTLIVCGCIPLARLFGAQVLHMYTERAQIYEACVAFITGNAGAYAGSLGRRRANDLWGMIKSGK